MGLAKIGASTALINTNLSGAPLAHSLAVSGAKHWILDAALAEPAATALAEMKEPPVVWASGGDVAGARDLDAALAEQSDAAFGSEAREGMEATDRLFYIYTSGTTGLPKAANFSHLRFFATSLGAAAFSGLTAADRNLIVLPLYHSAGGVMALGSTLLSGATAVIVRRFSLSRFWKQCVEYDVTMFQYIGELCRYLLNGPPDDSERRHRIRLVIGNGLRPEVWEPFQERFGIPRVIEFYGATEGNVAFVNLDDKVGAIGRMPGLMRRATGVHLVRFDLESEEVVRGPDGFCQDADVDEPGECIGRITNTTRFEGYSDAEATEKKVLRDVFEKGDAYFRTGDLLRRDADDYFYFVDRIGDTFRWKGENVSTTEVAQVIGGAKGVLEANVYGVAVAGADGRAGMASLVVEEGFDLAPLEARLEQELAAYARPLFLRLRSEIETTGTFKYRKVDAVKEGFDPAVVGDPLYFRDPEQGRYVSLDEELYARIQSGALRL